MSSNENGAVDAGTTHVPEKIITMKENLAYAAGDMASVFYFKVFSSFLMFFYTDIIGIEAAVIGTMLWITRIFDAFTDPLMGVVCDRTDSPHGKFRPWLRWMILPFAVSGVLIFTVPELDDTWTIVYVYATYSLAMLGYTAINIPYGALMGVMTPHSAERTVLSSFRFYGSFSANLVVQATILYLVVGLGGSEDGSQTQQGYILSMIIYGVCASFLFLGTFAGTKERVQPPAGQEMDLKKDLAQLFKNKPWVSLIFVGIATVMWIAMRDAAQLYYFKYYVVADMASDAKFTKLATWYNVLGSLATIAGVYFTKNFTDLFRGKKNAFFSLTALSAILGTGFFLCGPGDVTLMFVIGISLAIITGPLMPLFWSMIADTADYSEWKFGRRFTGLTFSAGTFSMKLGWAVGPALAAYSLSYYGYQDNVLQSERTIAGLRLMMSFFPAALAAIAAVVVLTYGINRKMELKMEEELLARKEAEGTVES